VQEVSEAVIVRPYSPENDTAFVFSSWLRSYRFSLQTKDIPTAFYYRCHHKLIEDILERPDVRISVACLQTDPSLIFGWACFEGPVLHYIFVKPPYRRLGIAKTLVRLSSMKYYTHQTYDTKHLLSSMKSASYVPYLAGGGL